MYQPGLGTQEEGQHDTTQQNTTEHDTTQPNPTQHNTGRDDLIFPAKKSTYKNKCTKRDFFVLD